jgi:diadenosine tetraphosphate (Ap4A) HIT family hydrolase
MNNCLFCSPDTSDNVVVARTPHCYARCDNFPLADGHLQVVPFRHVESLFDLTQQEVVEVWQLMSEMTARISADGWNVGVNEGRAAGRTVDHVHIHLIPRRHGDVPDPRGGVRNILPGPSPDLWTK